jgi:hypothetical protein
VTGSVTRSRRALRRRARQRSCVRELPRENSRGSIRVARAENLDEVRWAHERFRRSSYLGVRRFHAARAGDLRPLPAPELSTTAC